MSKIRSKGTKLEFKGFEILKKAKLNYRKYPKGIFGNPDAANKKRKIAIFFDSDFWHGFNYKLFQSKLKDSYWIEKINKNIKRDKIVTRYLTKKGWKCIRLWEHDLIKKSEKCLEKIIRLKEIRPSKKRL